MLLDVNFDGSVPNRTPKRSPQNTEHQLQLRGLPAAGQPAGMSPSKNKKPQHIDVHFTLLHQGRLRCNFLNKLLRIKPPGNQMLRSPGIAQGGLFGGNRVWTAGLDTT
jgi:hypothetical protein